MNKIEFDKIPAQNRIYCNSCKSNTRHELVWKSYKEDAEYDEEGCPVIIYEWFYIIWRCQGCDSVTFEERYTDNYQEMQREGKDIWDIIFHPNRTRNYISPKHFRKLPEKINKIYKESVTAYNAEAHLLTAVGLRSLIEAVCTDKSISGNSLEKKIDGLSTVLPENIVKNLHSLRFMGNDAVHELEPPSAYELKLAIEICEDLLNFLYALVYKTKELSTFREYKKDPKGPKGPQINPADAAPRLD